METKICSNCGIQKELTDEYFEIRKDCKCGFRGVCRECRKKQDKQYSLDNKEKISERKKQYRKDKPELFKKRWKDYQERNPERAKEYYKNNKPKFSEYKEKYYQENKKEVVRKAKIYYHKNKEKRTEYNRRYQSENKETILKQAKQYYEINKEIISKKHSKYAKENRGKFNTHCQKRRARKSQLPATLTIEHWEYIKNHFKNKCAYCGKELPLAQEHFIPLSKDGEYSINNIIPSCQSCNSSKRDKNFFKWYPKYRHYSKKREKLLLEFLNIEDNNQQLTLII